jgi:hypothetical protein
MPTRSDQAQDFRFLRQRLRQARTTGHPEAGDRPYRWVGTAMLVGAPVATSATCSGRATARAYPTPARWRGCTCRDAHRCRCRTR